MNLAIMQPYFFPYITYFQLIHSVDKFVFYDDVNFIKNGWINRNRILINGAPAYLTISLKAASSFKLIKDTRISDNRHKLQKSVEIAYRRAPFFPQVMPLIENCLKIESDCICDIAIASIQQVCSYLDIHKVFARSSEEYGESRILKKAERLKEICKINRALAYHNLPGGTPLYPRSDFKEADIELRFIRSEPFIYRQFKDNFVPQLSILDVLMFNSVATVRSFLEGYEYC